MSGERPLVEVLYFDGCPGVQRALSMIRPLAEAADARVVQRRVETSHEAEAQRFLGSPTVRVNGVDVEPGAEERDDFGLKCRLYRTTSGLTSVPDAAWLRDAFGPTSKRRIGPTGTALRVIVAAALVFVAGAADGFPWSVGWYDLALGLVAFPALTVILGFMARRYARGPVRFTGPAGHLLNCLVIVALVVNPYTGGAAALFYAATLLVAAWRGQPGCEVTVLSNWLLRRDDQIGCPLFGPIDAREARRRTAVGASHRSAIVGRLDAP
jgi:hypothetical protein